MYIYVMLLGIFTTNSILGMDGASTSKSPVLKQNGGSLIHDDGFVLVSKSTAPHQNGGSLVHDDEFVIVSKSPVPQQNGGSLAHDDEFVEVSMTPEQKQIHNRIEIFVTHWSKARWDYDQVLGRWRQLYRYKIHPKSIEEKKEALSYLANLMKLYIRNEDHYNDMKEIVMDIIEQQEMNTAEKNALKKHVNENFIFAKFPSPSRLSFMLPRNISPPHNEMKSAVMFIIDQQTDMTTAEENALKKHFQENIIFAKRSSPPRLSFTKISPPRFQVSKSAIFQPKPRKAMITKRSVSGTSSRRLVSGACTSSEKLIDTLRSGTLKKSEKIQFPKLDLGVRKISS